MKHMPLYLRVKEQLREEFQAARLSDPAQRLPTLDMLQARYQASRPTLSKALAALAAEGVLVKGAGRGAFALSAAPPEGIASALKPSRLTIGYISPISDAELPQAAFRGIDRAAHRRDCRVLMAGARDSVEQEHTAAREMVAAGVRGLVIYPTVRKGESSANDYLALEDLGVPLVLIDTCTPEQGHAQIVFDNRRAGADMTRWLLGRGHRRIGLILYTEAFHHPSLEARYLGYQDALRDADLPFDPSLVCRVAPAEPHLGLEEVLSELIALPQPPTAVITSTDLMAIEAIETFSHLGVSVPRDMIVTGFDNQAVARRYQPAFPTTAPDFERMGELAGETLLNALAAGMQPVQTYILPVPLLIRPHLMRRSAREESDAPLKTALPSLIASVSI